jgi:hypothetical protein
MDRGKGSRGYLTGAFMLRDIIPTGAPPYSYTTYVRRHVVHGLIWADLPCKTGGGKDVV